MSIRISSVNYFEVQTPIEAQLLKKRRGRRAPPSDCCALKAHTLLNDGQESEVTRIVARRPVGRDGNCSGNEAMPMAFLRDRQFRPGRILFWTSTGSLTCP